MRIYIYIYRRAIGFPPPQKCRGSTKHCKFSYKTMISEHRSTKKTLVFFEFWLSPIVNNVPRNGIASIEKWWLALPNRTMIHTPCQNLCKSGKYTQQCWLTFPSRSAAGCGSKGIWGVETGSRTYIYILVIILLHNSMINTHLKKYVNSDMFELSVSRTGDGSGLQWRLCVMRVEELLVKSAFVLGPWSFTGCNRGKSSFLPVL